MRFNHFAIHIKQKTLWNRKLIPIKGRDSIFHKISKEGHKNSSDINGLAARFKHIEHLLNNISAIHLEKQYKPNHGFTDSEIQPWRKAI